MSEIDASRLDAELNALPQKFRGPGGVAGVVRDGEIIAARAWGYCDLDKRRPMTRATRLPICSISKQFTCGALLAAIGDPAKLDAGVAGLLPRFEGALPSMKQLCDNQSGLRDYWALTVLQGAFAEQTFRREDALPLLARMKTGHFAPGTSYSYSNCNFRIVSELLERETGETLETLCRRSIWGPAGMETAMLASDTRHPADDVVGYEGGDTTGFFPADNGVFWVGDAGIAATLDDMLSYERWIDATRRDPEGIYNRLSAAPAFSDGSPARYGYGLGRETVAGVEVTGHGGALRGFRAHRMHAKAARLSVVVMFNHQGDAHGAAADLLSAALGASAPTPRPTPDENWRGQWLCPETGLLTRVAPEVTGATLRFATGPDRLTLAPDGALEAPGLRLERAGEALKMTRAGENLSTVMAPMEAVDVADGGEIAGRYHSAELEAEMMIEARDGGVYAWFEGMFGAGRMERVHPAGPDVWLLATRRSMDAPAPGDWTMRVRRDQAGAVAGVTLGCWLARKVEYVKAG